jgi:hypothetical protein
VLLTRPPDRDHYFEAEDGVKVAGLRVEMLLEDGALSAQVGQRSSPFVLLLDRAGVLRREGELDSVSMWNAAAAMQGHRGASEAARP